MDKSTAIKFNLLVNTPESMKALSEYADYRIEILTKRFLSVDSLEEVKALQKCIEELKRLKTLRDEVNSSTGDSK